MVRSERPSLATIAGAALTLQFALGALAAAPISAGRPPAREASFTGEVRFVSEIPFVSELHYDNEGIDEGEAIELVATAGFDLAGWQLSLYNGATGAPYATVPLSGTIALEREGHGALAVFLPQNGLQNGPDGIALIDGGGQVVEFLSYEGTFAATSGPAAGHVSVALGVLEGSDTPVGSSLQRGGPSGDPAELIWLASLPSTFGELNTAQSFGEAWPFAEIPELQGAGHESPWEGFGVRVRGVVTAVDLDGFYLQTQNADGNPETSDAIYAYTGATTAESAMTGEGASLGAVLPGDEVVVDGAVQEFKPGGAGTHLSVTELTVLRIAEISVAGGALPAATEIGASGEQPPTEIIDDDGLLLFDPANDGLDFWESLEGMRVRLPAARSVSPTNFYGETFVVTNAGAGATGQSTRGTLVESEHDANPERLRVRHDAVLTPGPYFEAEVGDDLGFVEGVLDYAFGSFEVRATAPIAFTARGLSPETNELGDVAGTLRLGSYNVKNLHPGDPNARFDALARHIVGALGAPEFVALQEIQDNDGVADTGEVEAGLTAALLTEAISRAGGPAYQYVDIPPEDGQDGGRPGANIRVGFLVDAARASVVAGATRRIVDPDLSDGDAFRASRKPLVIETLVAGRRVVLIGVHLTSRSGGSPEFGAVQPPIIGGAAKRLDQADILAREIEALRANDPSAAVVVVGDLNDSLSSAPLERLGQAPGSALRSLAHLLPADERYSFLWDGQGVLLDHVLVDADVFTRAALDIVHVNSEFREPASDHDPLLARLDLRPVPEPASAVCALAALLTLATLRRRANQRTI